VSFIDIVKTAGNVQGTVGRVRNFVESVESLFGVDVVGIFDGESFEQIFNTARPIKANVKPTLKIMDHPIETGAIVSDFAVILPVEIELSLMLQGDEYVSTYQSIRTYFATQTTVIVHTKAGVFENMLIEAMPHEESADVFDALPLALRLREVQYVTVQYQTLTPQAVQQPTDQSTVNRGAQQPKASALYQIGSYLKGLL
jgi:hypothetical protein